jgi:hypothetical protein
VSSSKLRCSDGHAICCCQRRSQEPQTLQVGGTDDAAPPMLVRLDPPAAQPSGSAAVARPSSCQRCLGKTAVDGQGIVSCIARQRLTIVIQRAVNTIDGLEQHARGCIQEADETNGRE